MPVVYLLFFHCNLIWFWISFLNWRETLLIFPNPKGGGGGLYKPKIKKKKNNSYAKLFSVLCSAESCSISDRAGILSLPVWVYPSLCSLVSLTQLAESIFCLKCLILRGYLFLNLFNGPAKNVSIHIWCE